MLSQPLEAMWDALKLESPSTTESRGIPGGAAMAAAIASSVLCRPSSFSWSLRNSGSSPAKITPKRMLTSQSGSAAISVVGQKRRAG